MKQALRRKKKKEVALLTPPLAALHPILSQCMRPSVEPYAVQLVESTLVLMKYADLITYQHAKILAPGLEHMLRPLDWLVSVDRVVWEEKGEGKEKGRKKPTKCPSVKQTKKKVIPSFACLTPAPLHPGPLLSAFPLIFS